MAAIPPDRPPARPNGQPPDGDLSPVDWGRHLRGDYRHDNLKPTKEYNIGGKTDLAKNPTNGNEFGEEDFFEWAKNDVDYILDQNTFKARMAGRLEWRMATETEEFDGTAPKLFEVGNEFIGVVTDAGKYLTQYLGAQNVISFGTCIDPAMSAITNDKKPVFYDVPAPAQPVFIDLIQFGFDPTVIRGIWIVRVLGAAIVKSLWIMGDGTRIDPVARRSYGRIPVPSAHDPALVFDGIDPLALGGKVINQTVPAKAGYYTSNANARDLGGAGADQNYYKIGKTLGDTMIVASAMKTFKRYNYPTDYTIADEYPNPYYGVGGGYPIEFWKNQFNVNNDYPYTDGREPPTPVFPGTIFVKTGDLLNTARAVFKGVPVVMERQARGDVPKYYEFYPGIPDPVQIIEAISPGYDRMISECNGRYNTLIANMQKMIVDTFTVIEQRTGPASSRKITFSGEKGSRIELFPADIGRAQKFINETIAGLENLKAICLYYLEVAKRTTLGQIDALLRQLQGNLTISSLDAIQQQYNSHVQQMLLISPQTETPVGESNRPKTIVVISRPGIAGIQVAEGVIIQNTEIQLLAAITAISGGLTNEPVIEGIKRQFLDKIPNIEGLPALQRGPAAAEESVLASIMNSLGQWILGLFAQLGMRGGGKQVGGADVFGWGTGSAWGVSADAASMTVGLVEYMIANGIAREPLECLHIIYDILSMRDEDGMTAEYYTDRKVASTIRGEFIRFKYDEILVFRTVVSHDQEVPDPDAPGTVIRIPHETIPLSALINKNCYLFSAFAAHINALNAEVLGGPDRLVEYFRHIERLFLTGILSASLEETVMRFREIVPAGPAVATPVFPAPPPARDLPPAAGAPPGGDVLPEVITTEKVGPMKAAVARAETERESRKWKTFKKTRESERERRKTIGRTGALKNLAAAGDEMAVLTGRLGLRAGRRRRTFRQNRDKKDKNAGDTA